MGHKKFSILHLLRNWPIVQIFGNFTMNQRILMIFLTNFGTVFDPQWLKISEQINFNWFEIFTMAKIFIIWPFFFNSLVFIITCKFGLKSVLFAKYRKNLIFFLNKIEKSTIFWIFWQNFFLVNYNNLPNLATFKSSISRNLNENFSWKFW